ncbi:GAF domain-containing sensor histidine kinase [Thalassomonas viridans]|uniref:histidine kinase n=1 Tax=Thalassomonas viridans TaxID=137584 RepID=A0AAE9YYJ4_9GAMM|nr:GAF domain-containing sensor histidine kinase [Thalassomonas viridans]WDE03581.1 GAF domain-containing sensor histidine kinase [Thalassomonas viridans]
MSRSFSVDYSTLLIEQWSQTLNLLADILDMPAVLIMKLDGEHIKVFAKSEGRQNPYQLGEAEVFDGSGLYCEHVIKTQDMLEVNNALKDPDWDSNPDIKLNMIYYLGLPLNYSDGHPFGTICALDSQERPTEEKFHNLLLHIKSTLEDQLKAYDIQQQVIEHKSQNHVENLIRGMAHELNTPTGIAITSASTLSSMLDRITESFYQQTLSKVQFVDFEKKALPCLELINTNLDKISKLVDRFKELSTQFSMEISHIRLDRFIKELCYVFNNTYAQQQVSFHFACADKLVLISIPVLLQSVVTQLVENAVAHAFEDTQVKRIVIEAERLHQRVFIRVSDNGIGIEKNISGDVFSPCFSRKQAGHLGLGLCVVNKIVQMQLKGTISLLPAEPQNTSGGTSFEIVLPDLT